MKTFLIGAVTFVGLTVITCVGSYISAHNSGAMFEANIYKFHESSKNTLSNYTLKLKEAAKVPDKYTSALQDVIQATFEGRYGEYGSKAAFQWIQENNIPLDPSVFAKLQNIIDAGREEFKLSQDRKLEICAQYEIDRNVFWRGFWLKMAGYPKRELNICNIIVDSSTTNKFETGVDEEVVF